MAFLKAFALWAEEIAGGEKYLQDNPVPQPAPTVQPVAPIPSPFKPKIIAWGAEIRVREGGGPNDPNTLHKNPGNLKWGSFTKGFPYTQITAEGFLVFKNEQDGMSSLCQFLTDACEGKFAPTYDPSMSILAFTQKYAEPPTPDYAKAVAAAMGLQVNDPISKALSG